MFKHLKTITLGLVAVLCGATLCAQEKLTVAGSDLMREAASDGLARFAKEQGLALVVDMNGTIPGLKELRVGKADFAIIARPPFGEALPEGMVARPLCAEVVYVAVNAGNPIPEISLRQLSTIYGQKSEVTADRWSGIGLTGVWGMRPLLSFAPSINQGISVEIFKNIALDNAPFKANVRTLESQDMLFSTIATQDGAIGFFRMPPDKENPALKILPVSTGRGAQGNLAFSPTMENAYLGDYPLSLPFQVVFLKGQEERLGSVLHYLYSEEFAQFLKTKGYLPLPAGIRRNLTLGVDKAK